MFDVIKAKCETCLLKKNANRKKFPVYMESDDSILIHNSNSNILVILDQTLNQNGRDFEKIQMAFDRYNLRCDYMVGMECETACNKDMPLDHPIPSPFYKIYKSCNTFNSIDIEKYDVIITLGKALYAITQSDNIINWQEFAEFMFNQTYFYTKMGGPKIRVYPLPALHEFFCKDNFENKVFVKYQISEIKKYLHNGIESKDIPAYKVVIVDNPNQFLLDNTVDKKTWALDLETNSLNPFIEKPYIKCFTMSHDGETGYYLDFDKIDINTLDNFLKNNIQLWAQGQFDGKWLINKGIKNFHVDEDIILLFHILSTERTRNSIKTLSYLIGFGGYQEELDEVKSRYKIVDYTKIPFDILSNYATLDPIVTRKLRFLADPLIEKQPQIKELYATILSAFPAFMEMEMRGFDINTDYLNNLNNELKEKIKNLELSIAKTLKIHPDKVGSTDVLAKALQKAKLPKIRTTTKGYYGTADSELKQWSKMGYEIADKIIEFRKVAKLQQTFVGSTKDDVHETVFGEDIVVDREVDEGLVKYISHDGRIHPSYGVGLADTVRTKHRSPNSAAFPSQGEEGRIFKPIIACPEDFYIMNMDVSGFQLRLGAIYSGDKNMADAFLNLGGDLHSMTAQATLMRNVSLENFIKHKKEEPYATYRFKAKKVNFALEFGAVEKTLSEHLEEDWTEDDIREFIAENHLINQDNEPHLYTVAREIRKRFFLKYPGLEKWHGKTRETAKLQGYVNTIDGGYRRHLPFLTYHGKDEDNKRYYGLLNVCLNTMIQAHEAIIMYRSIAECHTAMKHEQLVSKMMSMIHDYVGVYTHKKEISRVYEIVRDSFQDMTTYSIPIEIEITIDKIWEATDAIKLTDKNYIEVAKKLGES